MKKKCIRRKSNYIAPTNHRKERKTNLFKKFIVEVWNEFKHHFPLELAVIISVIILNHP